MVVPYNPLPATPYSSTSLKRTLLYKYIYCMSDILLLLALLQ